MKKLQRGSGKRLLHSRLFWKVIVIAVLVAGLVLWYYHTQTPAVGIIDNNVSSQSSVADTKPKTSHYTGSTMTFDYPANYTDTKNNAGNGNITEQLSLTARSGVQQTQRISITVVSSATGAQLKEDGGYVLRRNESAHYTHETVQVNGQDVEKFTKQDNSEVTYYISGPHYYAIVSGTAVNTTSGLADDITGVVGSFNWLK